MWGMNLVPQSFPPSTLVRQSLGHPPKGSGCPSYTPDVPPPNVTPRRLESALTPKQLQWSGKLPEFPLAIPTSLARLDATWSTRFTLLNPAVTWVGGKDSLSHHIPALLPSLLLSGEPGKQLAGTRGHSW